MPIRRVPLAELEAAVAEIEATQRIVAIGYPDEGSAVIHYEPRARRRAAGEVETRGAVS